MQWLEGEWVHRLRLHRRRAVDGLGRLVRRRSGGFSEMKRCWCWGGCGSGGSGGSRRQQGVPFSQCMHVGFDLTRPGIMGVAFAISFSVGGCKVGLNSLDVLHHDRHPWILMRELIEAFHDSW
jgi:hypothetical protein